MLKGYPLRKYTGLDWLLMTFTSSLVLQVVVMIVGTLTNDYSGLSLEMFEEVFMRDSMLFSVIGTLLSLPLTLFVVYWRKIPLFNRRGIRREDSFILPGMKKDDWLFLAKYIPISYFLYTLGNIILTFFFSEADSVAVNQEAIESMFGYVPVWVLFLMIVVVAPIVEELLFRGIFLFPGDRLDPSWVRVIVSAILFGLIHTPTNIPSLYTYVGMGFMFSYASKKTQSVEAAIVYHFINNLFGFIVLVMV